MLCVSLTFFGLSYHKCLVSCELSLFNKLPYYFFFIVYIVIISFNLTWSNRAATLPCPYGLHKVSTDNLTYLWWQSSGLDWNCPYGFWISIVSYRFATSCIVHFTATFEQLTIPFWTELLGKFPQLSLLSIRVFIVGLTQPHTISWVIITLITWLIQWWTVVILNNHICDFDLGEAGVVFSSFFCLCYNQCFVSCEIGLSNQLPYDFLFSNPYTSWRSRSVLFFLFFFFWSLLKAVLRVMWDRSVQLAAIVFFLNSYTVIAVWFYWVFFGGSI